MIWADKHAGETTHTFGVNLQAVESASHISLISAPAESVGARQHYSKIFITLSLASTFSWFSAGLMGTLRKVVKRYLCIAEEKNGAHAKLK